MNVNCHYIVYFSVKSYYPHFRSFEKYSCIILYCAAFYLSTFSHYAVRILASPESIDGGAPNCKTGELLICTNQEGSFKFVMCTHACPQNRK